jgi:phosphopantothenoylcysteine decarboxylase / phosphopantothenate---cysteine ligase
MSFAHILKSNFLNNKKVLITAGPTYEKIDPVRFIGNYSSGKMGYEIAKSFAEEGAHVVLVSGPSREILLHPNVQIIRVESAREMFEACLSHFPDTHIAVMAAAVADYRPAEFSDKKIKKKENEMIIHLVKNPDILSHLGHNKTASQIVIGFALETNNEIENAKEKLKKKNADAIILNSLNDNGAGFQHSTNKISIILKKDVIFEFPLKDKSEVAKDIVSCISENFNSTI